MFASFKTFVAGSMIAAGVCAAPAIAGFTNIRPNSSEANHEQILERTYGRDFWKVGHDYYSDTMVARRVDDYMSDHVNQRMNLRGGTIGDTSDQRWSGTWATIRPIAKFSDYTQCFGLFRSGAFIPLMDVFGYGFDVTGPTMTTPLGGNFEWGRSGNSGTHSSEDQENGDQRDHLITYEITRLDGRQTTSVWMLFWEDLTWHEGLSPKRTYRDYNDLVLEVSAAAAPIPLPAGALAGIGLLGLVGVARKRIQKIVR
jgi:hypothetical protein